jgi:hypothetical protein
VRSRSGQRELKRQPGGGAHGIGHVAGEDDPPPALDRGSGTGDALISARV